MSNPKGKQPNRALVSDACVLALRAFFSAPTDRAVKPQHPLTRILERLYQFRTFCPRIVHPRIDGMVNRGRREAAVD